MIPEPDCLPYSSKPDRLWRSDKASPRDWFRRSSTPPEWRAAAEVKNTPRTNAAINEAIQNSRGMLSLTEDWDDAGAKPISIETWERAAVFLRRGAESFLRQTGEPLPAPRIGPCADGSIDVLWRRAGFKLLVNVKPGGGADFYGENAKGTKLKGVVPDTEEDFAFLGWLAG